MSSLDLAFFSMPPRQMTIAYAKENNKPVILITNDNDWFYKYNGKVKGTCPELVQEMYDKAGVSFYSYKTVKFIKYARDYLESQVSDETIEEITNRDKYIAQRELSARNLSMLDNIISPELSAQSQFMPNNIISPELSARNRFMFDNPRSAALSASTMGLTAGRSAEKSSLLTDSDDGDLIS